MRGEQNDDMGMCAREILERLHLCGLMPGLTAETPDALVDCLAALGRLGFPAVEVEAVSLPKDTPLSTMLPQGVDMAVGVRAPSREHALSWLAGDTAWATYPCALPAPGVEQASIREVLMRPDSEAQAGMVAQTIAFQCASASSVTALATASPALWIVDAPADGTFLAQLLKNPSVLVARQQAYVNVENAQAVAEELHTQWVASLSFTLMHIGLNADDAAEANGIAGQFASLMGVAVVNGAQNNFAGTLVEVMKCGGRGLHGHIGFGTGDLPRAMYYAERKGFTFDPASRKNDAAGNAILYYLDHDIAGFAVHLLQR